MDNKLLFAKLQLEYRTVEQRMSQDNCIFLARVGSQMYGTNTLNSDDDFVGIFIPDRKYVVGLKHIDQVEYRTNPTKSGKKNQVGDRDVTLYTLRKWVQLALNNNPNIVELFFVPENCILHTTSLWKKICESKDSFLSLKLFHSFRGYAYAQRYKLELKSGNNTGRKDLIEKYGYDVKLASHNIRLYLECIQLLKEQQITFPLPERNLVKQIKDGKWSFDKFVEESNKLADLCSSLYKESKLPYSPNYEEVDKLLIEVQDTFWEQFGK